MLQQPNIPYRWRFVVAPKIPIRPPSAGVVVTKSVDEAQSYLKQGRGHGYVVSFRIADRLRSCSRRTSTDCEVRLWRLPTRGLMVSPTPRFTCAEGTMWLIQGTLSGSALAH